MEKQTKSVMARLRYKEYKEKQETLVSWIYINLVDNNETYNWDSSETVQTKEEQDDL